MTFGFPPTDGLNYLGISSVVVPCVTANRIPLPSDVNNPNGGRYALWTEWRVGTNPTSGQEGDFFKLLAYNQGNAVWVKLGSAEGGNIFSVDNDEGIPVTADYEGKMSITGQSIPDESGIETYRVDEHELGLRMKSPFVGDFAFTSTESGETITLTVENTSDTADSQASIIAKVEGTSSGDTWTQYSVGSDRSYAIGIDNSDDQRLKITHDASDTVTPSTGTTLATLDPSTDNLWLNGVSFDGGTNVLDLFVNDVLFTPSIVGRTSAGTASYSEQVGRYSRIGNLIIATVNLSWSGHTGTGDMLVAGFPQVFGSVLSFFPGSVMLQNLPLPANTVQCNLDGINNQTNAEVAAIINNSAITLVQMASSGQLYATISYFCAV